jgi:hypothetical protein
MYLGACPSDRVRSSENQLLPSSDLCRGGLCKAVIFVRWTTTLWVATLCHGVVSVKGAGEQFY